MFFVAYSLIFRDIFSSYLPLPGGLSRDFGRIVPLTAPPPPNLGRKGTWAFNPGISLEHWGQRPPNPQQPPNLHGLGGLGFISLGDFQSADFFVEGKKPFEYVGLGGIWGLEKWVFNQVKKKRGDIISFKSGGGIIPSTRPALTPVKFF